MVSGDGTSASKQDTFSFSVPFNCYYFNLIIENTMVATTCGKDNELSRNRNVGSFLVEMLVGKIFPEIKLGTDKL